MSSLRSRYMLAGTPKPPPFPELARFGFAVRTLRRSRNVTGPELARLAGVSKGLLSSIESGNGNPTLDTIIKLARALNVTPSGLIRSVE